MIINSTGKMEMTAARNLKRTRNCTLKNAARDFEAIFVGQLFKNMYSTVGNAGVIKQSFPRKIYEEMIQREYAKVYAKRGGLGLGKIIAEQLENSMEKRALRNSRDNVIRSFKEIVPKEKSRGGIQKKFRIENQKKIDKFYGMKKGDDSAGGLGLKERETVNASRKIR
ncbi:rod-binding protein [bacterium]|nr:rod-binding protein [bacterium]